MEQEIHPQQVSPDKKLLLVVIVSILLTALIVGVGVYFWQKSVKNTAIKNLEQKVSSLEQQLPIIENEQTVIQPTPINQQDLQTIPTGIKTFAISEVGIKVSFPNNYSLIKSTEQNRRGSFVSYDFQQSGGYKTPNLDELQFFSEESIVNLAKSCENTMCFDGDYPDLARYSGQKTAFAQGKDYQNYKLQKFNTRNWFVSSFRCTGDSCVIREYTTFLGNTKVDVWIMMADSTEEKQADTLFVQFKIE
ncbi:hypothetical protein CO026_01740 [Candidatus Kaiserbacteria bacterium CG_4_9_14_0_2_um_filter_41_32]|uniref:Uncharacterized protein n=1 Tax=Candidatus Kaiserbacteria bacterium CG_4_9_14_0_2_um_filter_41_32 TaxID=1974601 RepID=A0A2M8FF15_9BACT|nr:MAG: hypothetical protein CO026_01740 [Candidatus Kaiserbacteria bacterium CG_4_9_14_0_2_um_filter_41_32]